MKSLDTSESVKRCAWLLVAPWRLPRVALEVTSGAAIVCGSLALIWIAGETVLLMALIGRNPPWVQPNLARDVLGALVPCGIFPGMVVGAAVGCLLWVGRDERAAHAFVVRVIALSFVPFILPQTLWLLFMVAKIQALTPTGPGGHANTPIAVTLILDSCMWSPVLFITWLLLVWWSSGAARRLGQERGVLCICECGYDLRGSIAGGSQTCPECGESIPALLQANAPSIHPDN